MSSRVLLVDDARAFAELLAAALRTEGCCEIDVESDPAIVTSDYAANHRFEAALVDLSFPHTRLSGLDVLLALHQGRPQTRLIILTQGDEWVADLLRLSWEAIPVATALSKTAPVTTITSTLKTVISGGDAPIDPVLAPMLPSQRSPTRRADEFGRLVRHRGHAKLWRALIEAQDEPSYADLRGATGLKVNTLRNYREQIMSDLALHGFHNATLREFYEFAQMARPLLTPHIESRLGEDG